MKVYLKIVIVSCICFFSCTPNVITKSEIISTENLPSARHECGFVAVNGLLYLIGGRKIKPIDIFNKS